MKNLLLIFLLTNVGCFGGDDSGSTSTIANPCSPTKTEDSFWTNVSSGNSVDFSGTTDNVQYYVLANSDGVCDESDGEFRAMYSRSTLKLYMYYCDGTLFRTWDYEINCDNELKLYNATDGHQNEIYR